MSMYKNKTLYQPRTADPNTLTLGNLLTLTNIITSGIDHYSPSLGAFTSVQVAMPVLFFVSGGLFLRVIPICLSA